MITQSKSYRTNLTGLVVRSFAKAAGTICIVTNQSIAHIRDIVVPTWNRS